VADEHPQRRWVVGIGALILAIIAPSLWQEFRVPGNLAWNMFLALFLLALAVGAFFLQRYFWQHREEIGEARFDTSNKRNQ
jgi:hypothetical protein